MATNGYGREPARIGFLYFIYADPAVDVTTEQRTVEHETIDDQIVVQSLGRKPDQITVEGVVVDYELDDVDRLTESGVIELRTERWEGTVVVQSTSTNFNRARNENGYWLYDVTIECLEVDEVSPIEEILGQGIGDENEDQSTEELLDINRLSGL